MEKERIVIIGGGFAGLNLAKHLDPHKFEISLVTATISTASLPFFTRSPLRVW